MATTDDGETYDLQYEMDLNYLVDTPRNFLNFLKNTIKENATWLFGCFITDLNKVTKAWGKVITRFFAELEYNHNSPLNSTLIKSYKIPLITSASLISFSFFSVPD